VAGHRINLGKRERSLVRYRYPEIKLHPQFVENAAFPVGQAKFVIWWISTFPGPTFPSQQAIAEALQNSHPDEFDYSNFDRSIFRYGTEQPSDNALVADEQVPSAEHTVPPDQQAPPRRLADRITIPLRNRITIPLANRITIPLANRITFPADRVNSGRIQKRRSGSRS
jgi:hypothetical protein